ncbi:hypothetical protein HPB50_010876 [Hyalomma asiaticum]|uniref:Uncharacterized protein n=1 Tax=Hyalomma asiaticum TaxID=266040 RepID=A0ACB7RI77_HYAAI|nr:hypothetical protein HPB50_010876 [Hyalomma asiaticum]
MMDQALTTEKAAVGVDILVGGKPMTSEDTSVATFAEKTDDQEMSSVTTGDAINPDQRKVLSCRMPQTLSSRMVPFTVVQGDSAVEELENAVETSRSVGKHEKRQHRKRSSKKRPEKSRHRRRDAETTVTSSAPTPVTSRSAGVAGALSEASPPLIQADEGKEKSAPANATASRRRKHRKQRSVRQKRRRHRQLRGDESPKKLVVAAEPGRTSSMPPFTTLPPPLHSQAAIIAESIGSANHDTNVLDTPCSRACAMVCTLALVGGVAAVMATLGIGTVKVIGQRDRVIRDFDNWTLEQLAKARAAVAVVSTTDGHALFRSSSQFLHQATSGRVYFKHVVIDIPLSWSPWRKVGSVSSKSFGKSDVRVVDSSGTHVDHPFTKHVKQCGQRGEFIQLPRTFLAELNTSTTAKYRNPAYVFVHEWAHYRYGVFDEYGSQADDDYPLTYCHKNKVVSNNSGGAVFILMTDGEHIGGLSIASVKPKLIAAKVKVTTVALGSSADSQLEELALDTGGKAYVFEELEGRTIPNILAALVDATTADLDDRVSIKRKEGIFSFPMDVNFLVDDTVGIDTTVHISHLDREKSHVMVWLSDPDGSSCDSCCVDRTWLSETITIPGTAKVGNWTLHMKNPGSSHVDLYVEVKSRARDQNAVPVELACEVSTPVVHVPDLVIYAHLKRGDQVVLDADVLAEVLGPNPPRLSTTPLHDDGHSFEAVAPDGVLQVRPNERLNLLAVDTRSVEASERLLKVTNIGEIALQAYEPRPNNCGVGVIKGVLVDLDQQDIFSALLQRAPVKSVRRLGTSENVRIVFATETAPEYIVLGYTRYRVFKYIECPRQCSKCQRFGHVAGACRLPVRCPRCGGNHDRSSCATEQLQCPNCKKQHESTSSRCRVLRKEKEIHNYKMNHNVGYISAKAAIYEKRKAASRGSNDGTTVSYKDACKTAPENPPRIEDTEEFPSLPTRNLPLSPCVTAAKESTQGSGVRVQESTTAAGSSERRGPSVSWRGQRERSTRQDSSITYSLLSALVDAARNFLAPMSSPIAKVILTLLDFLSPVIERWR